MRFPGRLRSLFARRKLERDLDDELRFHIELKADEFAAEGMSAEEALYAAMRAFGNPVLTREETRMKWGWNWLDTLRQDVRYALRAMRRSPGFTLIAALSLALGIGANTAVFSLVNAVMLKMLPVQSPQQLVLLSWYSKGWPDGIMSSLNGSIDDDASGRTVSTSFSYPAYEQFRDKNHVLNGVGALPANESELNVGFKGEPARADGEMVSGTFFATLGVQPVLGRAIAPEDDRIGASPVAVISYPYWQRRFGRDPAILGKTITVNSVPLPIVGVAPPEFFGVQPGRAVEVWLPLHAQPLIEPSWTPGPDDKGAPAPPDALFAARDNWWLLIVGRLKPGVSPAQARAEMEVLLQQSIASDIKPTTKAEVIPHVEVGSASQGLEQLRNQFSKPLLVLMGVVGMVLLIACANVANLLRARATTRRREIAVRLAIGAKRTRLVRQLLTESTLLALFGGAAGLALAYWGTQVLLTLMSSGREPLSLDATPDLRVLGFTAGVSIATGILFGVAPALRSTRLDLSPALKENAGKLPDAPSERRRSRLGASKTLVVTQVALSLLLLIGAGLFVRTLGNLQNINTGFDSHNLLLFGIAPAEDGYGYKGQRLTDFYTEMTRRIEALPGVRSATVSGHTLIGGGMSSTETYIEGQTPDPKAAKDHGLETWVNPVGPAFVETMRIPVLLGRGIGEGDTAAAPKVAVVNQEYVRKYLAGASPLGRRFGFDEKKPKDTEIVGVVADARYSDLRREVPPTAYLSFKQSKFLGPMHFEVRTAGDPIALVPAVRRVARDMDPNLALYDVRSETEQIDETLLQERLFARLTGFFGALAALLGSIGVYGVMAFATTRRTREIGIRIALGASRREILGMVLGETFILVGIGVAAGLAVALAASHLLTTFLYGLKPNDPLTIAIATLLMVAAAALAGYLPARRAARVDPMVALREE